MPSEHGVENDQGIALGSLMPPHLAAAGQGTNRGTGDLYASSDTPLLFLRAFARVMPWIFHVHPSLRRAKKRASTPGIPSSPSSAIGCPYGRTRPAGPLIVNHGDGGSLGPGHKRANLARQAFSGWPTRRGRCLAGAVLESLTRMTHPTIHLGIIGAGRIGQLHAAHLRHRIPGAQLVAVTDAIASAAQDCASKLGIPEHGTDYRRILENPAIQAVVICSPTDTHTEIIQAAAAAGKHIFCEKPIDVNLARIDMALEAVKKAGVLFQVGFNRRFDANFQRARVAVVQGEIGMPHQVHIISRDPSPPPIEYIRQSGGIFLDMTIHDFDMAQFLIDSPVVEVFATGSVRVDPAIGEAGDLDTVTILLNYENGATCVIENCRQAVYGYDQRVEVFGSAGSIRIDNNYPNNAILSTKASVRRDLPLHFFLTRYSESYISEMICFLEAIQSGRISPVAGGDARVPVVMALAARKSIKEKRPVRLSEIG